MALSVRRHRAYRFPLRLSADRRPFAQCLAVACHLGVPRIAAELCASRTSGAEASALPFGVVAVRHRSCFIAAIWALGCLPASRSARWWHRRMRGRRHGTREIPLRGAWGLFAAGLVSAVLGLLQYYGLAEPLAPWTTSPEPGQAYGNLRQRNQFATLISMALIAALWLHAAQRAPCTRSHCRRPACCCSLPRRPPPRAPACFSCC